ncbi:MarR family winged helix-turn-helix transcriptional regulator [Paenibacillus bovis]|uniref:HTH-type transcriptional regulator SarZ n=1 Tax=Paenibacillus bovis TaxID=1616788 RepID=A0A172ZIQ6_9BACL|nr:MarR family transcriptional regulator [Paenibacillus bovis]ANF97167.1 MarR family transcriptional regulator [Paenibacillus bovis]
MESTSVTALEQHICFSLYAGSRAITRMYWPMLEEMGITYPQYITLVVLWEKRECTIKELGKEIYLDSGTMTSMLKRMEENGLITRQRSTEDERVVNIKITEKGMALQEQSRCLPQSLLDATGLSSEELQTLNQQLRQLISKLQA